MVTHPPLRVVGRHLQAKPFQEDIIPAREDTIPPMNTSMDSSRGMLRLVRFPWLAQFELVLIRLCSETASAAAVLWTANARWTPWAAAAAVFPVFAVYGKQEGPVCESCSSGWVNRADREGRLGSITRARVPS